MKKFTRIVSAALLLLISGAHAFHKDVLVYNATTKPCYALNNIPPLNKLCVDNNGESSLALTRADVRLRFIDPFVDDAVKYNFGIQRPVFIIDGIYLSTDGVRTLSALQKETEEFGIPEILKNLGYTPILVQFSETVRQSLENNAKAFAGILDFLNSNKLISFANRQEDGYIVMGISQGGIIGRYGAYLYDKARKDNYAPIRLFSSIDSPHQGAILPRGLISTLDFWANTAGVAAAEAFNDLVTAPGAHDLLLYNTTDTENNFDIDTDESRFLFGEYRKAANYKGFPAVLISQGQMKGKSPSHANTYYLLNRAAKRSGETWGRADSRMYVSNSNEGLISHNHVYEYLSQNETEKPAGVSKMDFVQGSTYPFAKTIYDALRDGMIEAIPDGMTYDIMGFIPLHFDIEWDDDTLYQDKSTFIPTASAMDLQCNGDLAIRSDCAFSKSHSGFPFENPGSQSTGKSAYAVDSTHPRYDEPISGRHIESPVKSDGSVDSTVLKGMQTDVWRVLCEVAKVDYDSVNKEFRNPKLVGMFSPTTNCMDRSKMPEIISNGGIMQKKDFGYIRYDYNKQASESDEEVSFNLPSGWQKVALIDNAKDVPEGAILEFDIKVTNPKSNWMKAELLLTPGRNGGGQVQLDEKNVELDGKFHTIRWQMPTVEGAMQTYRWFRIVLNGNGGTVSVTRPRLLTSSAPLAEKPEAIKNSGIFPTTDYKIVKWNSSSSMQTENDGNLLKLHFADRYDGIHFDFGGTVSLDKYKELKVEYMGNTCQNSEVYFGTSSHGKVNLGNNSLQNAIVTKLLPLSEVVNTKVTSGNGYSASRLTLQALKANESCSIRSISLQ